ncbi:hypothetical protein L1887_59928 [Cichorium endivia]|nr:hypothetical protein L1887_59928 [Cichorium endivia]
MRPPHLFFASSPWPENRTVAAAGCGLRAASCGLQLSVALVGCPRPTVQHCNTRASHLDHGVCCVFARSPCLCRSMVPETSEHSVGPSAVGACSEPRHRTLSSTIGSLSSPVPFPCHLELRLQRNIVSTLGATNLHDDPQAFLFLFSCRPLSQDQLDRPSTMAAIKTEHSRGRSPGPAADRRASVDNDVEDHDSPAPASNDGRARAHQQEAQAL